MAPIHHHPHTRLYTLLTYLIFITYLVCLPHLSIAEEETAIPAESQLYHLPNIPLKRTRSLVEYMTLMERQEEVVQLSSIDEAGSIENYYGLFLADASGTPQGGVLILHDNQQHGHWPDIVAPLREYLPRYGWATLSIELPDPPARQRLERDADDTQAELDNVDSDKVNEVDDSSPDSAIATNQEGEPTLTEEASDNNAPALDGEPEETLKDKPQDSDSEEPALPRLTKLPDLPEAAITEPAEIDEPDFDALAHYRKQNQQRILAAMGFLRSEGQFNLVIIGHGIGAAWAIDYLHQQVPINDEQKGMTLITIDAIPSPHSTQMLSQQLTKIQIPFLDLVQPNKAFMVKRAKKRLAIMKRNNNNHYQQIITSNMSSYHESENPTNRRIRGWLKTHASGTLVKLKP